MADYIDSVVAARRRSPRDDLISILTQAEEGDALTSGEVLSFDRPLADCRQRDYDEPNRQCDAGDAQHLDVMERVATDRACIPAMLEETLRYDSPIQGIPRQVLQEVELGGTLLPKGAFLMVLFASANRDERQFPDADRFDIDRKSREHVAFGHGIHFCLGAALARLEARVAFETLFGRCRDFRLQAEEINVIESNLLRGPRSLPIRFVPHQSAA